jgi:hypothetical protein
VILKREPSQAFRVGEEAEQLGHDPLESVLLEVVAGVVELGHGCVGQSLAPFLENRGRERRVAYRPHDPRGLGAEVLLEPALEPADQFGDPVSPAEISRGKTSAPVRVNHVGCGARYARRTSAVSRSRCTTPAEQEAPDEHVEPLHEYLADTRCADSSPPGCPPCGRGALLDHTDPPLTLRVYAQMINEQLVEAADIFAKQFTAT